MLALLKMLLVYGTLGGLAGIVGIPYSILAGNVDRLYRVTMWIVAAGVRASGIRVDVTGLENLPAGTCCIFLANHVSNLDPTVILPAIPGRSSVLLKKGLMRIPLLGTAMRLGGFVPVERGNRRDTAKASVNAAVAALKSGLHILIFAEGTRSEDGRLGAFKRGTFYLAMETGAPIVPVAISGTEKMMRKHSAAIRPGVARVQMLPPIYPSQFATREELMRAVRHSIAQALPEEMRPKSAI
jgi:1-acyl-sn-glycerol-3-phosphate acyltransferase